MRVLQWGVTITIPPGLSHALLQLGLGLIERPSPTNAIARMVSGPPKLGASAQFFSLVQKFLIPLFIPKDIAVYS